MDLTPEQLRLLQDMDMLCGLTMYEVSAQELLRPLIEAGLVRQTHFIAKGIYEYELTQKGREVLKP